SLSPSRLSHFLDGLVFFQHRHPIHHGCDGVANLRIDQFTLSNRSTWIGARSAADCSTAVRRTTGRRREPPQTHDMHADGTILDLGDAGFAHLLRHSIAAIALRCDDAAGAVQLIGATFAPIPYSQLGAARGFGASAS